MIPPGGSSCISPTDAYRIVESKMILSEITRDIEPVVLIEFVIDFCIQVIEIKTVPVDISVFGKFQK